MERDVLRSDLHPHCLHPLTCLHSDTDIMRMTEILTRDPESLERHFQLLQDPGDEDFETCFTSLQLAIKCHHVRCVEFLISKGANIRRAFGYAGDAVSAAILFNDLEILELMISKYNMKPSNDRNDYIDAESSSLYVHNAAQHGSVEALQILLNHGAKTENIEYLREPINQVFPTPAILTIMYEKYKNLKFLLVNGAICDFEKSGFKFSNRKNYDLLSMPLRVGVSHNNNLNTKIEIIQLLHDFGLNLLKPAVTGHNLIDILTSEETRLQMKQHLEISDYGKPAMIFQQNDRKILIEFILLLSSTPMSLAGQCRLVVMKNMGPKYSLASCKSLNLPEELKNYLHFN